MYVYTLPSYVLVNNGTHMQQFHSVRLCCPAMSQTCLSVREYCVMLVKRLNHPSVYFLKHVLDQMWMAETILWYMYMFPFWALAHCTVIVQIICSFLSKYLHIVEVLVIIAKSRMNIYLKVYLWIFSFSFGKIPGLRMIILFNKYD